MIIVGGLPNPIGGVTSFLKRVVDNYADEIELFVDLYPNSNKLIPASIYSKYIVISKLFLYFFLTHKINRNCEVFFNFSTIKAILYLFIIPKRSQKWYLMLHHGDISSNIPSIFLKFLFKKIDFIFVINEQQFYFFSKLFPERKIIKSSSYLPAKYESSVNVDIRVVNCISDLKNLYDYIFCCSGSPSEIYRHDWSIQSVISRKNSAIIVCLYGEGDFNSYLEKYKNKKNVVFLNFLKESDFNYILKNIDCYLRPNSIDSFGIAVADAINFGCEVIASDVCERYKGVILFNAKSKIDFFNLVLKYPFTSKEHLIISNSMIEKFYFR